MVCAPPYGLRMLDKFTGWPNNWRYHHTIPQPHIPSHHISPQIIPPTTLYHTIPYHTIPYHTIPYHTTLYHAIPYHTTQYHSSHYTKYHTTPYNIILVTISYTIPYHTICYTISYHNLQKPYHTITIPYNTITYNTTQYHTTQYHTTPYHIPHHLTTVHCSFRLVQYGATVGFYAILTCLLVELKLQELAQKGILNLLSSIQMLRLCVSSTEQRELKRTSFKTNAKTNTKYIECIYWNY